MAFAAAAVGINSIPNKYTANVKKRICQTGNDVKLELEKTSLFMLCLLENLICEENNKIHIQK